MLYFNTVDAKILELLIALQQRDSLQPFYLVGGTALALQPGHRTSTDIDLFTHQQFDTALIRTELK